MIALLTGGSGCGKSTYAEKLVAALPGDKRYYIATMRVYDRESELRVARHRAQRADMGYATLECPLDLEVEKVEPGAVVLLEDLPNWLANEMFDDAGDVERMPDRLKELARRCAHLVIVTNDVFSDGVVYSDSTEAYRRRLAGLNRLAVELADYAAEVIYSIPVPLKGEAPCL